MEIKYTDDELLEALKKASTDEDRIIGPTYQGYLKGVNRPSAEAIRTRFGGWTNAIREAGMIPGSRRTDDEMKTLVKLGKIDSKYVALKIGISEQQLLSDLGLRETRKPTKERYIEEGVRIAQKIGNIPAFHEFNAHTQTVTAWNPYRLYERDWQAFQRDIEIAINARHDPAKVEEILMPSKNDAPIIEQDIHDAPHLPSRENVGYDNIGHLFDELLKCFKVEEKAAIKNGSQAFQQNEYDRAQQFAALGQGITAISESIQKLFEDWLAINNKNELATNSAEFSYNVSCQMSEELIKWLDEQLESKKYAFMHFPDLLKKVSLSAGELDKKKMIAIAQLFSNFGYGIEPDVRFNSPFKCAKNAILFRTDSNAMKAPSSEYTAAALILHLAAIVSGADGEVSVQEEDYLEAQLESWLHLSEEERIRLRAHTKWLTTNPLNLTEIKRKLDDISDVQKEMIGILIIDVAQADGHIDNHELRILENIYELLVLNKEDLYKRIHFVTNKVKQTLVMNNDNGSRENQTELNNGFDRELIQAKLAETAAVTALLSNIFIDQVDEKLQNTQIPNSPIPGLDIEQIAFAKVLIQKTEWSREDLEIIASESNLLLDGALASINEAAFDITGEPFFEGDNPLEINQLVAKELFHDGR